MDKNKYVNKKIKCQHCHHENLHMFIHAFGVCEKCGKRIEQCNYCGFKIPNGGKQSWRNLWVQFRLLEEKLREKICELI